MKVNWGVFFENSSTEEAIVYFVQGKYSFKEFSQQCWPKECKLIIKSIKHKGYKKCRRNVRAAMLRRGYSYKDWKRVY